MWKRLFVIVSLLCCSTLCAETLYLRDNLGRGEPGDFIVTQQNRNYTVLHIMNKGSNRLVIEEITVPSARIRKDKIDWRKWVEGGAPQNTSWVVYRVNLDTGVLEEQYSFTGQKWMDTRDGNNFLSTLLNLQLEKIPQNQRTRVGRSTRIWNPVMVVDGKTIEGVRFDAWRTLWPQDQTELSGKKIEVYVPEENDKYPSYFPYWLQIRSMAGKAQVRIVDSGTDLHSPKEIHIK